jgi:hypothetical protein
VTYHIQFDLDVGHKAQAVATAAKIGREWVIAGLHDMWAHCFRVRGNTVSDMLLTGFFGAPIGHVLEAFGFLETAGPGMWRVKGTDRYTSITDKRKEAGRRGGQRTQEQRKQVEPDPPAKPSKKTTPPSNGAGAAQANQANASFAQANVKQTAQEPPFAQASAQANTQANGQNGKQSQALYPRSDNSSLREEELSRTHESAVGGPPQHAPGRGRAVAPPKPEPEPEPEWQPLPLCAAGLHNQHPNDKACAGCARVEREKVAAEKLRLKQAEQERIAAIPPPPKEHMAEGLTDAEMGPLLDLYVRRLKMRQAGQDWREAMQ